MPADVHLLWGLVQFVAGESVSLFSLLPAKSLSSECFFQMWKCLTKAGLCGSGEQRLGSCALWVSLLNTAWDSLLCRVSIA